VDRFHDASPDSMLRIGVAPCSPFSVTDTLLKEAAALARDKGVRLHTHLAETMDEDAFCRERFGCGPVDYMDSLGWLGSDVWYGHGIHLDDAAIASMAATGTGVAHCPTSNARLGAGIARVRDLRDAGVPVGLGVDGSASNERSDLAADVKQALLVARGRGGPEAMTVREALWLGTRGGAQVLGRKDLGSLEPGKCADFAVWNLDGLQFGGADDPVAALVLSGPHRAERVYVGGEAAVLNGQLARADEREIAAAHRVQAARFLD